MNHLTSYMFVGLGLVSPLFAQTVSNPGKTATPTQHWQDLVSHSIRRQSTAAAVNKPEVIQAAKTRAVAAYTAQADQFRAFYMANPKDAHVGEAECREAQMLLNAAEAGDTTTATRLADLISRVRKDTTISGAQREALTARYEYQKLSAQQFASRTDKMAAYEQTARAFATEFPDVPLTYASLLHIAIAAPDDRASAIANDLLQMPAPKPVQLQAQIVLNRLALKGLSLPKLADAAIGSGNAIDKADGKPVILYSWSYSVRDSLTRAAEVATKAPAGAAIFGLCLDPGPTSSSADKAAILKLPGEQIYDAKGPRGALANQLFLTKAGAIYTADAAGVIRSVSAQHDIDTAFAALGGR